MSAADRIDLWCDWMFATYHRLPYKVRKWLFPFTLFFSMCALFVVFAAIIPIGLIAVGIDKLVSIFK